MASPFESDRLFYRAIESPDDDKFFRALHKDPFAFQNSNTGLIRPQSRRDAAEHQKAITEGCILAVIICIQSSDASGNLTSIGEIHIDSPAKTPQYRHGWIGINIAKGFQGQGYGTEAIHWALDWAFDAGGLHKVNIAAFEWNYGARKLYEKIGFQHEGTVRELYFHKGRFWGDYYFGILDREWREMKSKHEEGTQSGQNDTILAPP